MKTLWDFGVLSGYNKMKEYIFKLCSYISENLKGNVFLELKNLALLCVLASLVNEMDRWWPLIWLHTK